MRRQWLIAVSALAMMAAAPCARSLHAQQGAAGAGTAGTGGNGTAAKPQPAKVGSYSLVVTTLEPTAAAHWLHPAPAIAVKAGSKLAPAQTAGDLTVPPQFTVESFGVPEYECEEAAPQQRGCAALDRVDLFIRDANTVEYRIVSHGAAVGLRVNLQVHDLLPVAHGGASADWHSGDLIFVSVPKATPVYRFVAETLIGQWNGAPVVFETGKALPAGAKKALDDLGIRQDLGDAVLYSYKVK